MIIYQTTKSGGFYIDGMSIPNDERNHDYQRMREEESGGLSTIEPYVEDLENLLSEKIQRIKDYGLAQIQRKVGAINSINMAILIYKDMWPQNSPSADLLAGEAVFNYAVSKLAQAQGATRDQLEGYDPSTDVNWP